MHKKEVKMKNMKSIKKIIVALLIVLSLTSCQLEPILYELLGYTPFESEGLLSVVFINTGNSDSIFVNFPDGRKMLIDAAESNDQRTILDVLKKYNTQKIDYAVNTHQHSDHIGAYPEILKVYDTDNFYMPKSKIKNDYADEVLQVLNSKNKAVTQGKAGMILSDDEVYLEILSPMYDTYSEENDYSLVLYLKYGDISFLFMGDAENKVENDLLNKKKAPAANVLKVGHHGSSSSSSKNFLNAVQPEYAVITTGKNSYGHPTKKVTNMLHAMNIKTYRTDLSGNITFTTDGVTLDDPQTDN